MKKQRLLELADWLGKGAKHEYVHFNMSAFMTFKLKDGDSVFTKENICGTTCCIAGCAVQFYAPEQFEDMNPVKFSHPHLFDWKRLASKILGLSDSQAEYLFFPPRYQIPDYRKITPQWAAKVIRHMVETGDVDWMKFAPAKFKK